MGTGKNHAVGRETGAALPSGMYVLAIIRYRRPMEEVLAATPAHRAYLRGLHERGLVLVSGPFEPRTGGAVLLRVSDMAEMEAIRDADPFTTGGIAEYELHTWVPTIGTEAIASL